MHTGHFFTPAFMLMQEGTATETGGTVWFGALGAVDQAVLLVNPA